MTTKAEMKAREIVDKFRPLIKNPSLENCLELSITTALSERVEVSDEEIEKESIEWESKDKEGYRDAWQFEEGALWMKERMKAVEENKE